MKGKKGTQLSLPHNMVSSGSLPKAARDQLTIEDWDWALVALARVNHPGVFWWWGARQGPEAFGAMCYICDTMPTTWSRRYPMTEGAKAAMDLHRATHFPAARGMVQL